MIQKNWAGLSAAVLSKSLRYHLLSERCPYLFFFVNILILSPYMNWTEYWPIDSALFRDLFSEEEKVLQQILLSKVLCSEARHTVPRRHPFGTLLPTRPCGIRVIFTQWLDPVITRLTRCYLRKSSSRWIAHNLKEDSWTTRVVLMRLDSGFVFPHRDTSEDLVSGELDFHWFPVDQWVFEVFRSRIHVLHIELSLAAVSNLWRIDLSIDHVFLTPPRTDKLYWFS